MKLTKMKVLKRIAIFSTILGLFLVPYQLISDVGFDIPTFISIILIAVYLYLIYFYSMNFQKTASINREIIELEKKIKIAELKKEIRELNRSSNSNSLPAK